MSTLPLFLLLFTGGALAGSVGGLLGLGGGILAMPLLRFVVGLPPAEAAATCVLAVCCTTLGGSYRHWRLGRLELRPLVPMMAAGALTTVGFSFAFVSLSRHGSWLDFGIGVVFSMVALRMLYEGVRWLRTHAPDRSGTPHVSGPLPLRVAIGAGGGVLPGLLGIGTGALLVPAFHFLLGTGIKTAMAASLACFSLNAVVSAGFKISQGFVRLDVAVPLCAGTILGANLGALLQRRAPSTGLKVAFGMIFVWISYRYLQAPFGGT